MNQVRLRVFQLVSQNVFPATKFSVLPARHLCNYSLEKQTLNKVLYTSERNAFSTSKFWRGEANPKDGAKPDESSGAQTDTKPEDGSEVENQLRAELDKAVSEAAAVRAKASDFEDKYLRALAEMENLRTRMTKQVADGKLYATQSFCKDLADIEDILQLAITSVPKDQVNNSNKHLKELYEGLVMTEARLLKVFKNHGLTQINPIDSKFNPNEHEAVMQTEQKDKESGTVIFVSKVGYKLHDRVIRPAVVGVAK